MGEEMLGSRIDKSYWAFPKADSIHGRYCRLVRLGMDHVAGLWPRAKGAAESFTYLRFGSFDTYASLADPISDLSFREERPFWAVIGADDAALGWVSVCDVSQTDGAFEIGNIWAAPSLQGRRAARGAIFLLMCLGVTHEGTWRNAVVVDGWQRHVAWFSIIKAAFTARLDPTHFGPMGFKIELLQDFRG